MKTILAVDPSIKAVGWAVFAFENRRWVLGESGVFKPRAGEVTGKDEWVARLDNACNVVSALCLAHQPELVVIEQPIVYGGGGGRGEAAQNSGDLLKLCAVAWSIRQRVLGMVGEVVMVPVNTWKGNVPKEITQMRVRRAWGWKGTDHNEADAVGIGDWWLRKRRT